MVLCPQVAAAQAGEAGHSTQAELELLAVHGILHLLGYDHAEPDEKAEMFGLQDRLLKQAGKQEGSGVMSAQGWLVAAAIVLVLMAGWWASAEATLARLSAMGAEQLVGTGRPASKRCRLSSPTCPAT